MQNLNQTQRNCLLQLLSALINQEQAQTIVTPQKSLDGFWFGGGNLTQDQHGTIWLSGRYRNYGDSRIGLEAGQRGLECVILRSDDGGKNFTKVDSWSKAQLSSPERKVLSIEGTALHQQTDGSWELFVSSEKEISYPEALIQYQKPGTGVWTIDRMTGSSPTQLDLTTISPILENQTHPEYLHVKDPVVYNDRVGNTVMLFCSHPFSWTSSNSGLACRVAGETEFQVQAWEVVSRGASWDVAATRITAQMPIPQLGCFAGQPASSVYFYDGAECLRSLDENQRAYRRPRGYSCEEIGGALFSWDDAFPQVERLSVLEPLFVSPWGTGCSRYVDALVKDDGILAIWQQGQDDGSQPLVGHFLAMDEVERLLTADSI